MLLANETVSYVSDLIGHSFLLSQCDQFENLTLCMLHANASYKSLPSLMFGDLYSPFTLLSLCEQNEGSILCFIRVIALHDTVLLTFGNARFGRPLLFFVHTIPIHLRWVTLTYLDYQASSVVQAKVTALNCCHSCLTRSQYLCLCQRCVSRFAVVRLT